MQFVIWHSPDNLFSLKHRSEAFLIERGADTVFVCVAHPVHFAFHDTTGKGIVLEYTKKDGMTFYDNTVGAMTNSPDYGWHMENLRNYPHIQREEWTGYMYDHLGKTYEHPPHSSMDRNWLYWHPRGLQLSQQIHQGSHPSLPQQSHS